MCGARRASLRDDEAGDGSGLLPAQRPRQGAGGIQPDGAGLQSEARLQHRGRRAARGGTRVGRVAPSLSHDWSHCRTSLPCRSAPPTLPAVRSVPPGGPLAIIVTTPPLVRVFTRPHPQLGSTVESRRGEPRPAQRTSASAARTRRTTRRGPNSTRAPMVISCSKTITCGIDGAVAVSAQM